MSSLSDEATKIAIFYMGPAARKFLERQTFYHMNRLPFLRLDNTHLAELARWIEVSAGALLSPEEAAEFAEKIRNL